MTPDMASALHAFDKTIIFYPSFRRAFSQIQNAIENTQTLGRPVCALLSAPSGLGKSTLLNYFRTLHQPDDVREDGVYTRMPVIYCEVPAQATVKGLITNILRMLINRTPGGTREKLTHQLVTCLITAGVKVIFLDEIQRLCVTAGENVRVDSIAWIVSLLNTLRIPIILSGTEECINIRDNNRAFARRYPYLVELNNFLYSEGPDSEFYSMLQKLDSSMYQLTPLGLGAHLNDRAIASALYVATNGNIGTLRLIISDALKYCLNRNGTKSLTANDFLIATEYIDLPERLSATNPFTLSYSELKEIINEKDGDLDE